MRKRSLSMIVGLVWVGCIAVLALATPWLPIDDPHTQDLSAQYAGPSWAHPLGQGENGIDLLSNLLWGARLSLALGFGSVLISATIGGALGAAAGYFRGTFDAVLMRVVDIVYAFPGILLVVALAAVLGPSPRNVLICLVLTSWAGYARLARALALTLRERDYVLATRALGAPTWRILGRHIGPNLLAPLVVQMTFGLGSAIMTESSLSFLGLGAPPGTPSWGQLLNQGRDVLTSAAHGVIVPGAALVLTVLGFNLIGDGLRDVLDPRR